MDPRAHSVEIETSSDNQVLSVEVYFGIFFDGTRNNRKAAKEGEEYRELVADKMAAGMRKSQAEKEAKTELNYLDSAPQKKDQSNVSKLEPYFYEKSTKYACRMYMEGIATNEQGESTEGEFTGTGTEGIEAKVKKAIEKIPAVINTLGFEQCVNIKLNFELFGFSRGAAAARHFVWKAKEEEDTIKDSLKNVDVILDFPIAFNYVGLFDTVSAHGKNFYNDVSDLKLDEIRKANNVFQICASDEFTPFFELTDITSAKNAGKGKEVYIPGDHSDIGGGHAGGKYSYVSFYLMQENANGKRSNMFYFSNDILDTPKGLEKYMSAIISLSSSSTTQEKCRDLFKKYYDDLINNEWLHCSKISRFLFERGIIRG